LLAFHHLPKLRAAQSHQEKETQIMQKLQTTMMLLTGLVAMVLAPSARADEWNQKTIFTFSGPVEIPGQILPAGTYMFRLADSPSHRHIVQIYNEDQSRLLGMFLAIPDYHLKPADKPIIKFHERTEGSPEAIKAWFYPGRNYGHEFVYPKKEAVALAKVNNTPVPAMPNELIADAVKPNATTDGPEFEALSLAIVVAERPRGIEVQLADAFQVTDSPDANPQTELPDELPTTASALPLVGLLGLLSLGSAAVLRRASARTK
jgi:hypothetical protein